MSNRFNRQRNAATRAATVPRLRRSGSVAAPALALLLAAAALIAVAPARAQDNAQPREIPKGFVLPGPAPTGGSPKAAPAKGVVTDDGAGAGAARPMAFAKAPAAGTTNWPCVQRKVGAIEPAQVWSGPSLPETAPADLSPVEDRLIDNLAGRRLPLDQAEKLVTTHVEQLPAAERSAAATRLMAGLLAQLNNERNEVMTGIERYGAKQKALAKRLREQSTAFAGIQRDAASSNNDIENARQALLWDTRVFDERRRSLTYVCEVPTLIEQRAFALGRVLASNL